MERQRLNEKRRERKKGGGERRAARERITQEGAGE